MQTSDFSLRRSYFWKLAIGVFVFVTLLLLPVDLPAPQHRLLTVLGLTFTFWVTEALPLPVTALLAMVLCVVMGILPTKQAFNSLGNPVIFLFLGAFLLAEAVRTNELDRRIVEWFLSRKWVSRSPFRILTGFSFISWAISGWMSNTATTATIYPLAWQAFQGLKAQIQRLEKFGLALMLVCTYSSSIGGIMTPVGTPPNLIGLGFLAEQANVRIGFLQWMLTIVPVSLAMMAFLLLMAWLRVRTISSGGTAEFVLTPKRLGGPLTKSERNTFLAFGTAVGLWVFSGIASLLLEQQLLVGFLDRNLPELKQALTFLKELPEAVPALIGSIFLFVLPSEEGKPTLG